MDILSGTPQPEGVTEPFERQSPTRKRPGRTRAFAGLLSIALSVYALYWVVGVVQPQIYRVSFLLMTLVATFVLYPARRGGNSRVTAIDWVLVALTVVSLAWPILDFSRFLYRAATPNVIDVTLGAITLLIILEATRRTVGWILPATAVAFIAYGYFGPLLDLVGLSLLAHRGYPLDRLVGTLYMTLEGIFGVPLDVASTYIILFSIYGAILEYSGAGRFFLDWAMAVMGRDRTAAGPGRAVTLAGFLLGTVSGSGVATTVTLGSVAWPLLRSAGYPAEVGGAILSAAGIGAILSPPTLGAAAFLIAEFLDISYLTVLMVASIPTLLYYLSIFLMIEADSRRLGTKAVMTSAASVGELTSKYGYHFTSLVAIAAFMAAGMTAFKAVFWATLLACALSFVRRETALGPRALLSALEKGGMGVLPVAATTATAGIIVGVVLLTGLGLKIAGIIVTLAGASLFLTVLYAAIAVWVLGLAVPVTASYIIAAVMVAPALTQVGVQPIAAHMFIFYYAMLSEVSPPTALSPFAAAALTGANPFRTMMITWKYTMPAFLVPFAFTLTRRGTGLLLEGSVIDILWTTAASMVGVAGLACAMGGWLRARLSWLERIMACAGGLVLLYADPRAAVAGLALCGGLVVMHVTRVRRSVVTGVA